MDSVDAILPEQLSGTTWDSLIEQELHEAVGRSAVSSPTMAAA
jgi:hypothetical protein